MCLDNNDVDAYIREQHLLTNHLSIIHSSMFSQYVANI